MRGCGCGVAEPAGSSSEEGCCDEGHGGAARVQQQVLAAREGDTERELVIWAPENKPQGAGSGNWSGDTRKGGRRMLYFEISETLAAPLQRLLKGVAAGSTWLS